jgi:hypothetical protein
MQGESDRQRELLDVEAVAGHLLPVGSVFAFLAEHRHRLFPAELFADLFPSGRGRPSIPGEVIASVICAGRRRVGMRSTRKGSMPRR